MVGDIKTRKTTIAVTWPPLSFADTNKIINAIESGEAVLDALREFAASQDE